MTDLRTKERMCAAGCTRVRKVNHVPLVRYLRSQVGRQWVDVWSAICSAGPGWEVRKAFRELVHYDKPEVIYSSRGIFYLVGGVLTHAPRRKRKQCNTTTSQ